MVSPESNTIDLCLRRKFVIVLLVSPSSVAHAINQTKKDEDMEKTLLSCDVTNKVLVRWRLERNILATNITFVSVRFTIFSFFYFVFNLGR